MRKLAKSSETIHVASWNRRSGTRRLLNMTVRVQGDGENEDTSTGHTSQVAEALLCAVPTTDPSLRSG
jgi:hypothetical protein